MIRRASIGIYYLVWTWTSLDFFFFYLLGSLISCKNKFKVEFHKGIACNATTSFRFCIYILFTWFKSEHKFFWEKTLFFLLFLYNFLKGANSMVFFVIKYEEKFMNNTDKIFIKKMLVLLYNTSNMKRNFSKYILFEI